jgi:hypothetical protein
MVGQLAIGVQCHQVFSTSYCQQGNAVWYTIYGQKLARVNNKRDLGVVTSNDLKSFNQCHQANHKASPAMGMIKCTIQSRDPQLLVPQYKMLVRPYLEYCTPCWSPHYSKDRLYLKKSNTDSHIYSVTCLALHMRIALISSAYDH